MFFLLAIPIYGPWILKQKRQDTFIRREQEFCVGCYDYECYCTHFVSPMHPFCFVLVLKWEIIGIFCFPIGAIFGNIKLSIDRILKIWENPEWNGGELEAIKINRDVAETALESIPQTIIQARAFQVRIDPFFFDVFSCFVCLNSKMCWQRKHLFCPSQYPWLWFWKILEHLYSQKSLDSRNLRRLSWKAKFQNSGSTCFNAKSRFLRQELSGFVFLFQVGQYDKWENDSHV